MTVNIMKQEFIFYKEALALKELGFDEPCFTFYPKEGKMGFDGKYHSIKEGYKNSTVNDIWIKRYKNDFGCVTTPTYSQAFRWFREKQNIFASIDVNYCYKIYVNDEFYIESSDHHNYEEAELACLRKLIEIAKLK